MGEDVTFLLEPTVHLLAAPVFYPHPEYKLPVHRKEKDDSPGPTETLVWPQGTDCERLIAHAGKGCYDSYGEDGRDIDTHIEALIGSYHGSVLEHVQISLFLTGISRGLSHELVRHRAGFAYSQRSTRYTNEGNAAFVFDPFYAALAKEMIERSTRPELMGTPFYGMNERRWLLVERFKDSCIRGLKDYRATVEDLMHDGAEQGMQAVALRKWARGKARQLLPHALETRITVSANLRAWRMFLETRSERSAEPEIRRLSNYIFRVLEPLAPCVFADYIYESFDGFDEYRPKYRKV